MLVYGDHSRSAEAGEVLAGLVERSRALGEGQGGLAWHGWVVGLLIDLGCLLQGVADRESESLGCDEATPVQQSLMAGLLTVAAVVRRSWQSAFAEQIPPDLGPLAALALHGPVELRRPEGFAFYALYPEAYLEAARQVPAGAVVIGLRSIGTTLAAVVAEASGARELFTLRPRGHPFAREVRLSPALERTIAVHAGDGLTRFVIVDEGPGLSGSSFGGVADWLERRGVARERIVFMPGHGGDLGPQASDEHRRRWRAAARPFAGFEAVLLADRATSLPRWFEDLTGPATRPMVDLSGGAWARAREAATDPGREARKFLLEAQGGRFRLKFVGLDQAAAAKFERAEALHRAGLGLRPLALRHGFLLEEHVGAASPARVPVARLRDYLRFRAEAFPAERPGASLSELVSMAASNLAEADPLLDLTGFAQWASGRAEELQAMCRPVQVDARLHRWEWLDLDGRIIKTDALDHAEAHDLVGCQDIAWDVAGAVIEHGLGAVEARELAEAVLGDRPGWPDLLQIMTFCYLGFQTGWWSFSSSTQGRERSQWYAERAARFWGEDGERGAAARPA